MRNPDDLRHDQLLKIDSVTIIDVRPSEAFSKGHIQGAKNIPAATLDSLQAPRDSQIVVYCGEAACALGDSSAEKLRSMGFLNVSVLDGGLSEWAKHNYPMERGAHLPVSKSRIPRASPEEVLANTPTGQIIIDSRPIIEFSAGHLPGARNLPLEEILKASPSLPKEAEIIVYDRQSARSRQAVQKLLDAGCKASELSGGLAAWVKKGYPVEVK